MTGPSPLERLYHHLGRPAWYWPTILTLVLIVAPLAVNAIEGACR